ncbi:hypothetical protein ABZ934_28010 [Streptomyces sp. NPDC046557]|uniref:hypothetical protein n=1 Tax=Streptomyces sp. NPDC046557 TaxID=3155372 RepID=UPI0034026DD1
MPGRLPVFRERFIDLAATARRGRPLVLICDSGTGKSHLLIGIGTAIAETGLSVRVAGSA